jgi:hypothetical protein
MDLTNAGARRGVPQRTFAGHRELLLRPTAERRRRIAERRYNVHLHLFGTTWRLSGLDIPEEIVAGLARQIAARVAGSAERGGGERGGRTDAG